jgi:hypothetical protein
MANTLAQTMQPHNLLNHILDQPGLVGSIRNLDARVLSKLIQHIGLEDAGELVSLATVEQLKSIFDEDLWRSDRPGKDETFDADRFAIWLEIMLESGPAFAAQTIMDLDEDLITLALCRLVIVINLDDLLMRMSSSPSSTENELLDKELESCLCQEFGEYLVISKSHQSWEAICSVLAELNEQNFSALIRLLERCCHISIEYIDDNGGLYNVLTSEEMLESDIAAEREQRRERKGFVSPSAATSFLNLIRITSLQAIVDSETLDPITQAYFRSVKTETESMVTTWTAENTSGGSNPAAHSSIPVRLLQTLQDAEVISKPAWKKLEDTDMPRYTHLLLTQAISAIKVRDDKFYSRILMELSYLSNVLISGCSFEGRYFRPVEAAEAVLAVCNLGSDHLLEIKATAKFSRNVKMVASLLTEHRLIKLFKVGWKILYNEVSLYSALALQHLLSQLGKEITDQRQAQKFKRIVSVLKAKVSAGKPWLFRSELNQLGEFIKGSWVLALKALLDEYPTMPKNIKVQEQFQNSSFISTINQIQEIQKYLRDRGMT